MDQGLFPLFMWLLGYFTGIIIGCIAIITHKPTIKFNWIISDGN